MLGAGSEVSTHFNKLEGERKVGLKVTTLKQSKT